MLKLEHLVQEATPKVQAQQSYRIRVEGRMADSYQDQTEVLSAEIVGEDRLRGEGFVGEFAGCFNEQELVVTQ